MRRAKGESGSAKQRAARVRGEADVIFKRGSYKREGRAENDIESESGDICAGR